LFYATAVVFFSTRRGTTSSLEFFALQAPNVSPRQRVPVPPAACDKAL
jgi:hypothetical protein